MKRLVSLLVACAIAGGLTSGCAKSSSSSDQGASATASGPITDSGSTSRKQQSASSGAMAMGGDAMHGKAIFTQNCSSCHGATGLEGGVGPSLKNEKSRKDLAKTVAWIKNPQPPMPKLYPQPLSEKDVDDVAAYVHSL